MSTSAPPADRLGTGWSFPPKPGVAQGGLDWLCGPALVRQSILLILDTEPGERLMRPDFGCGLRRFLMEQTNPGTRAAIAREVEGSLRTWEPRIALRAVEVDATDDAATVLLSISYLHVRDQTQATLEVPFALAVPSTTGGQ
jgi:phage baseplate assembly protein W